MTKRTKFRLPYVGEDGRSAHEALAEIPVSFKTFHEHACCVCACPFAPFGVGYPETTKWFCRKHIGGYMPEVLEAYDRNRLREICRRSMKGAQAWLQMYEAAQAGDVPGMKALYGDIRAVTVEVSDFLKALGTEAAQ